MPRHTLLDFAEIGTHRQRLRCGEPNTLGFDGLDVLDRVEHPADDFQEGGSGALIAPALESFFANVPTGGELLRGEVHVVLHFGLPPDSR